ncbi:hypothetical protein [Dethiobacter alkaliphilus]|uniref:Uncharacterized protein n=1 Tax=Dethiobacter alkaliphilus AHT 1 TaxID=555088 RepID=C0GC95_DETAL|nr:hypothetical protein [Dethiobacter alkaliphilus]EEG78830.1 hypothetical protein DealDRAFT_0104 [Dethiobacter alkaliphilus AHT 1]
MKKFFVVSLMALTLLMFSGSAFANSSNHVAQMARMHGGEHIAECAQTMDQGVSAMATADCVM